MDALCTACSQGPSKADGHAGLWAQSIGRDRLSFRCERCGSLWGRTATLGGGFAWASLSERASRSPGMGVALPPRSSSY